MRIVDIKSRRTGHNYCKSYNIILLDEGLGIIYESLTVRQRKQSFILDYICKKRRMLMKKVMVFVSAGIFIIAVLAFAAEVKKTELRPAQIVMQARAAWLKAMSKNLGAGDFPAIVKDANGLAAQTKKIGDGLANPLAKDITLAISVFANEASAAAAKKDADTVKVKLGAIKSKCDECHAKIRDKK